MFSQDLLKSCPTIKLKKRLYRYVTKSALDGGRPPNYLFTSGLKNRLNGENVHALYMGDTTHTALIEYEKYFPEVPVSVLYACDLNASKVIDLSNPNTCKHLSISNNDLYASFRRKSVTRLQELGAAIVKQTAICAIRFPSAACRKMGKGGNNIAIFKDSLAAPDSLELFDESSPNPDRWP